MIKKNKLNSISVYAENMYFIYFRLKGAFPPLRGSRHPHEPQFHFRISRRSSSQAGYARENLFTFCELLKLFDSDLNDEA